MKATKGKGERKTRKVALGVAASETDGELSRLATENRRLRRQVAQLQTYRALAYRDPLTGLWNRRFLDERLKEELSRARRAGADRKFSVMIIDLNWFKELNDAHGHQAGDAALTWLGEFLIAHLRAHDVACRTGGDEFAVLLPDLSSADCAQVIARLRQSLQHANAQRAVPLDISIGAASFPEVSESAAALLSVADTAMYADKRTRRTVRRSRSFSAAAGEAVLLIA